MFVHIFLFLNIMLPGRLCKLCRATWCTNFLTVVWEESPRKVVNTVCCGIVLHRAVELDKTSFAGYSGRIPNTVWICLRRLNQIPVDTVPCL